MIEIFKKIDWIIIIFSLEMKQYVVKEMFLFVKNFFTFHFFSLLKKIKKIKMKNVESKEDILLETKDKKSEKIKEKFEHLSIFYPNIVENIHGFEIHLKNENFFAVKEVAQKIIDDSSEKANYMTSTLNYYNSLGIGYFGNSLNSLEEWYVDDIKKCEYLKSKCKNLELRLCNFLSEYNELGIDNAELHISLRKNHDNKVCFDIFEQILGCGDEINGFELKLLIFKKIINELLKIHNKYLPLEILDKSKYKNHIDILKNISNPSLELEISKLQSAYSVLDIFNDSENENEVQ